MTPIERSHQLPILGDIYTKQEVDELIAEAVAEAQRIDELSMAQHNRNATIISMILGSIWFFLIVQQIEENNESNN